MTIGENPQDQMLTVGTLDSKEAKPLFKTTSRVLYAEPGYLLFVRERTLVAQKFDVDSLSLEGEAIPLGEGLGVDDVGLASFSVSRNGLLVFRAGELQGRRLVWIDRSGKETPAIDAHRRIPRHVAVARRQASGLRRHDQRRIAATCGSAI